MNTYRFLVTYTNDKREVEVKARSEEEARYLNQARAVKALMVIVNVELLTVI